ncbi:hypothetical protein DLE04_01725 [Actinobacteria bacterium IMCC26103]|nr:hypothetical protein DLE04_01725 [Actinobacteria bacterium IMCC26103]
MLYSINATYKDESPYKPEAVLLAIWRVTDKGIDWQKNFKTAIFTLRYKWALSGSPTTHGLKACSSTFYLKSIAEQDENR